MDKILPEHRQQIGTFEVLEIDPERSETIRSERRKDSQIGLNWTWEYGSEVEELRNLYEKGKANQWNAQTDLDWRTPVSRDDWVLKPEGSMLAQITRLAGKDEATQKAAAFDELAYSISQLLHGEQAALQLCGQLTNVCDKLDQKFYAASQVIDEARHVEVFAKFLREKMGEVHPIGSTLKVLLDELLTVEGHRKKLLGMQTLFEGMAVGIMDMMRQESANPLFSTMLHKVEQDESRHAAFGVLQMRREVKEASEDELAEMEDWAFAILEALNANQQLDMLRVLAPRYELEPEPIVQMFTSMPEFAQINSMPFMHTVVPNLKRLGLLTERTEDRWKQLGMMTESRADALRGDLGGLV